MWVEGLRTRADNSEQVMSLEEPNFLGRRHESLELDHPVNTMQEATMLWKISFRKRSQQYTKKYLRRRLLRSH